MDRRKPRLLPIPRFLFIDIQDLVDRFLAWWRG